MTASAPGLPPAGEDRRPSRPGAGTPARDTRAAIIDAAVTLIANRGFSATSVDEIAAEARVAKGSVFYNFGSKAALFEAVIVEGVQRLTVALRTAREGREGREAMSALVSELLVQIQAHPDFAKVIVAEVFRTGRDWQEPIRQVRNESFTVLAEVVAASWPGRDPSLTAATVFGGTLVAGLEWLAFQPHRTADDVREAVLSTFLDGLPA